MTLLLQAPKEISSFCEGCSDGLSTMKEDESCIELIQRELPVLLNKKNIFLKLIKSLIEGGKFPDPGRATMFDNELILYIDSARLFSLRMFLWGPGEFTEIHDHNSWGVIGPVSGVLEVVNYERKDDELREGYARLFETKRFRCLPGETSFTRRLNEGIHKIGNPTDEAMVSLGLYGKPMSRNYLNGFNLEKSQVFKILAPKTKKKILAEQALSGLKD